MQRFLRIIILSLCLAILSGSSMAFARERLVFAVTLIRHGDRAPVHEMPASPCNWIPGLGELTPLGINQEYLLGQSLRTRYVDQFGLLPPKYQYNSIYACSTDYNRTIMSAQALLCGLYPPGTGPLLDDGLPALPSACQPIPVRTTPEDRDRILRWQEDNKERLREILRTTVFTTVEWQKMSASAAHKFSRWSQIFGVRIENLLDLIPPGDNVNVRLLKGISLPVGLTEAEAREIVKLSQWAMAQECRPQKIGRLIAGNFLQKVITDMQKAIEGTQEYKFILYSGHDSNILPVMAALGTPLEATPPYASNVCFELYQDKDEYSVKVRYNGEDLALPGAGGRTDCTFKQFMTAVLEESR
jgi:lysosomal acid phosphatase